MTLRILCILQRGDSRNGWFVLIRLKQRLEAFPPSGWLHKPNRADRVEWELSTLFDSLSPRNWAQSTGDDDAICGFQVKPRK